MFRIYLTFVDSYNIQKEFKVNKNSVFFGANKKKIDAIGLNTE